MQTNLSTLNLRNIDGLSVINYKSETCDLHLIVPYGELG